MCAERITRREIADAGGLISMTLVWQGLLRQTADEVARLDRQRSNRGRRDRRLLLPRRQLPRDPEATDGSADLIVGAAEGRVEVIAELRRRPRHEACARHNFGRECERLREASDEELAEILPKRVFG